MRQDHTSMETSISTIGTKVLVQYVVKWACLLAAVWLTLSYVDGWVHLFLATAK